MYSLKGLNNILKEITEKQERREAKRNNKLKGYAPKCSICNNENLDEIEKLREEKYTYQEIIDELELDCSIMALSRHFKNHYPKSQAYKQKQLIKTLESTKEAYHKYPFLEDYFKDKDIKFLEKFNQEAGFCTDKFGLCNQLDPNTVSNSYDNIYSLFNKTIDELTSIRDTYYSWSNDLNKETQIRLRYHNKVDVCLNCKNHIQEERINLLEKIITYNFLDLAPENKELYFNLLQYDGNPEEFIESLTQISKDKQ